MRDLLLVVTLAQAVAVGCGGGSTVACTTSGACPSGSVCVDNVCRPRTPSSDGGPEPDGGPQRDGGPDSSVICLRGCGDVDVDGDGTIDESDFTALPERFATDACLADAADVDRDGVYGDDDEHALRAIVAERAVGVCEACGACGDVDGNGEIDAADAALANGALETTPTTCTLLTADVDRDGVIDLMDARIVLAIAEGRASAECAPCAARSCGDANGDGAVDVFDTVSIRNAALGRTALEPCAYAVADVVRDGVVDVRDAHAATQLASDGATVLEGACEECPFPVTCGDVNGDGVVGSADSLAIGVIRTESPPNVCRRARADLNADGHVNARDAYIARAIFLRQSEPAERCPSCTLACGDVNQDGAVSAGDLSRMDAVLAGAIVPLCERDAADINGDGNVDARDQRLLSNLTVGALPASTPCPTCTLVCGDVNQDGGASGGDLTRFDAVRDGGAGSTCERDAADINGDGRVDERDRRLLTRLTVGLIRASGACTICTGVCGDLNGDGIVTAADRGVVTTILETTDRLPTPCELDDGDIDHDGDVDATDRDLITAIIAGTPPAMACGR